MQVHLIKNELLRSCTYILYDSTEYVFLIDCGDSDKVLKWIKTNNKIIKGIFLTHCHYDHIYGLGNVLRENPFVILFASKATIMGLKDENKNLSYIIKEENIIFNEEFRERQINEGCYTFDTLQIEVLHTPGHSDDCLSYIIEDYIFTGDSFIPHTKVFANWPTSNKLLAIEQEQRLVNSKRPKMTY